MDRRALVALDALTAVVVALLLVFGERDAGWWLVLAVAFAVVAFRLAALVRQARDDRAGGDEPPP